jgi:glycosyltransferase involved in cell wall biosynthesis
MREPIKFSVVMPIHNEEAFLPYSLPSVYRLHPDEVILLFDWCSDKSMEVAVRVGSRYGMLDRTFMTEVDSRKSDSRFAHSFGRLYGSQIAKNDIVLFTAGDMILDSKITSYIDMIGKDGVAFISFVHKNYPVDWRLLIKRLLVKTKTRGLGKEKWLGAIMLYDRRCGFECEKEEDLQKIINAQDTHLRRAIATKYKTLCFTSNTIHLRPMESKRHYLRGKLYWIDLKRSFLVTLLSSVMILRLNLLKGYIHARFGGQPC